jgi:hypothetical protein
VGAELSRAGLSTTQPPVAEEFQYDPATDPYAPDANLFAEFRDSPPSSDVDSAEQGDVNGQLRLGQQYFFGDGVPENYGEAAKWFRLAAEQGQINAQYLLRPNSQIKARVNITTEWLQSLCYLG